jgi:hypothetical protein
LEPGDPFVTRAIVTGAGIALALAVVFWSRRGGALALVIAGLGWVWQIGGRRALWAVGPALALVWLCIPLPFNTDQTVVAWFTTASAKWGGYLLDLFHVPHVREGTWFEVGSGRGNAELFTGIGSPFALAAAALVVATWRGRGVLRTPALVVSAVLFAVPVGAVVIALAVKGLDASGAAWSAEALAAAAFWGALVLALSLDQLFGIPEAIRLKPYIARVESADAVAAPAVEPVVPRPPAPRWLPGWPAAAAFGVLLVVQLGHLAAGTTESPPAAPPVLTGLTAPDIADWVKAGRPGSMESPGIVLTARYQRGRLLADLAVFVSTAGHDDPVGEFDRLGWKVRQHEPLDAAAGDYPSVRLRLERPLEAYGTLWLANCSAADRSQTAVNVGTRFTPLHRLMGRRPAAGAATADRWLWVFVDSYVPLDAAGVRAAEQLFLDARTQIGPRITAGEKTP